MARSPPFPLFRALRGKKNKVAIKQERKIAYFDKDPPALSLVLAAAVQYHDGKIDIEILIVIVLIKA